MAGTLDVSATSSEPITDCGLQMSDEHRLHITAFVYVLHRNRPIGTFHHCRYNPVMVNLSVSPKTVFIAVFMLAFSIGIPAYAQYLTDPAYSGDPPRSLDPSDLDDARARIGSRDLGAGVPRDPYPPRPDASHHFQSRADTYVAGQFGYSLAYDFRDVEGTGALSGGLNNLDLKNSFVYGAKVGRFFSDRWSWLDVEAEVFNSNPHIKQQALGPGPNVSQGSNLMVTTVAFNVIARGQLACRYTQSEAYPDRENRFGVNWATPFCPLQPYVGIGVGVFFAWADNGLARSESLAVPGLNALAGVRYFVTRNTALFGEYKYNRASFSFDNIGGNGAGVDGIYSASLFVAGISFHFF